MEPLTSALSASKSTRLRPPPLPKVRKPKRPKTPELVTKRINPKTGDVELEFNLHAGQYAAITATERFIGIIAGTQSGKTSFGPIWLYQEIQLRGPGDYIVVTPTFPLLEKKALPEFLRLFEQWLNLGTYNSQRKSFTFSEAGAKKTFGSYDPDTPTVVWFGYAADPDSLESATAKAAWLDEAGQKKFKLESWRAILRRLSLACGRVLITTTPYDLGWLKQQIYDRAIRVGTPEEQLGDSDYRVIRFDSTENPLFSRAEFDRAENDLPPWQFNLFYRGIFTRPAGQIYECFINAYDVQRHPHLGPVYGHKCKPFAIPSNWPVFVGADFGNVNTAAVKIVENPAGRPPGGRLGSGRLYLCAEYHAGNRSAKQHVAEISKAFGVTPEQITRVVGGAKSEDKWREEFTAAGLPIMEPPVSEVEVGINIGYGIVQRGELLVFDTCEKFLEQIGSYSRELDPLGNATEEIEDKAIFHLLDAYRYIGSYLRFVAPPDTKHALVVARLGKFRRNEHAPRN